MMGKLDGEVAVITGSSRGQGRAAALLFAQEGADIVVNYVRTTGKNVAVDSDTSAAQEVVDKVKELGRRAIAVEADVGNLNDHQKLVDAALNEFGKINILYNNAAVHYICKTVDDVTPDVWDMTHNIIVKGPFFLTRLVASHMLKQGGQGKVLFTLTGGIVTVRPSDWHYLSAKGAVSVLIRVLAGTYGPKIRVNGIIPGAVMTDMFRHHPPEVWQNIGSNLPMGRMAEPIDVARVALYLVSPESEYLTGHSIPVDGGGSASQSMESFKRFDKLLPGVQTYDAKGFDRWKEKIDSGLS